MPDIFDASAKAPKQSTKVAPRRRTKKENVVEAERYSSVLRDAPTGGGPLSAYCPKPSNVSFEVQHDDEPILLLLRQHPIVNIGWIALALILLIAPLFLPYFPILGFFPGKFQSIAVFAWYAFTFGFILENFLMWFFNIYIITDERVIDVDFFNLLFKRISEAKIENIEDITSSNSGFLQSIFDYGQVQIQTAAEIPEIEFENVPHPEKVSKFLSEMMVQEEQEKLEGRVR